MGSPITQILGIYVKFLNLLFLDESMTVLLALLLPLTTLLSFI